MSHPVTTTELSVSQDTLGLNIIRAIITLIIALSCWQGIQMTSKFPLRFTLYIYITLIMYSIFCTCTTVGDGVLQKPAVLYELKGKSAQINCMHNKGTDSSKDKL